MADDLRADRELMMQIVAHDGRALQYASEELRSDRELVPMLGEGA